jgi:hypothetical protein
MEYPRAVYILQSLFCIGYFVKDTSITVAGIKNIIIFNEENCDTVRPILLLNNGFTASKGNYLWRQIDN